jgi:Spirocyclase AveC-like
MNVAHRHESAADTRVVGHATASQPREGSVIAWAAFGVCWSAVALNAWLRWMSSEALFGPAAILAGDHIEPARLIALRGLELISTLLVVHITWIGLLRPWLRDRRLDLDGMLLLGGVIGFSADCMLNLHELLFAFNAHSVNLGAWTSFLPFYTDGPARYAESLLWGFPMYVYFGIGASYAGCAIIGRLRARHPRISNAAAFSIAYVVFVGADFALENAIIRATHAYVFVKTWEPLTVFAGSMYQFPIYESLLASLVCLGFTAIRQSARDAASGLSFVERGASELPMRWRTPVRTLAVIGACGALFIFGYHLPFNWLGLIGTSVVDIPSYLMPG